MYGCVSHNGLECYQSPNRARRTLSGGMGVARTEYGRHSRLIKKAGRGNMQQRGDLIYILWSIVVANGMETREPNFR